KRTSLALVPPLPSRHTSAITRRICSRRPNAARGRSKAKDGEAPRLGPLEQKIIRVLSRHSRESGPGDFSSALIHTSTATALVIARAAQLRLPAIYEWRNSRKLAD